MKAQFSALLDQLPEDNLRELIRSIHGLDEHVDKRMEIGLIADDGLALAAYLREQVQLLNDSTRTVEWARSGMFSRKLDELVAEIARLVDAHPREAFELVDMFMDTHEKVYKRCDDSDSGIGGTYYTAMQLWIEAAKAWKQSAQPCQRVWHEEVLKRHVNNTHAIWDHLVVNSQELLGAKNLQELGAAFQSEITRLTAASVEGQFDYARARAETGLRSVAEALGDVSLFEWSFVNAGKPLDERQKEQIAKFCLAHNDGKAALRWVTDQWQWCEDQRLKLLDQSYGMLGQFSDLLNLRRKAYNSDPSQYRLADLLEVAPEKEHARINAEAIAKAAQSENLTIAVNTLFALQSPDAANDYVLKHRERLGEASAHSLSDWANCFEEAGHDLPALLCFRTVLLDILDGGRSKLYKQAAQHYLAIARLSGVVDDYSSFRSADEFEAALRKKHGRKRSFWSLVD